MRLRIRYREIGIHVRCSVYSTTTETFAKCGELTFTQTEFPRVVEMMNNVEFLKDGEPSHANGNATNTEK